MMLPIGQGGRRVVPPRYSAYQPASLVSPGITCKMLPCVNASVLKFDDLLVVDIKFAFGLRE
jgi:hypothetical protein